VHARRALLGIGEAAIEPATIVIRDGIIESVGRRGEVSVPVNALVHDFADGYVLPGLIDTHVHVVFPGDARQAHEFVPFRSDLELLVLAIRNAERALRAGITTMRDLGSRGRVAFVLREAIAAGLARGPRLLVSGPPITIPGGHCHYLGGEATGIAGVRERARSILESGADVLKVMGSGGGTPGSIFWQPAFDVEEVRAAAEEAHALDVRITVHTASTASIDVAIAAGVDMLEHANMWEASSAGPVYGYRADLVDRLVETGMYVGPTLQASYGSLAHLRNLSAERPLTAAEAAELDKRRMFFDQAMDAFPRMRAAGVQLVAGTDAGWHLTPFGSGYLTGLQLAAQAGMPGWEVVEHATGRAAAAIGLGGRVGQIKLNHAGDLLVVGSDPFQGLETLREPLAVFQAGRLAARSGQLTPL
jgi:imidazolonepropionase-like amidohydrolase